MEKNICRILAVDDEESIRNVYKRLFKNSDCEISLASTAEEALEILKQKKFSIIISDKQMPGMCGIELARFVRNIYPEIVIISVSGTLTESDIMELNKLNVSDIFSKPFDIWEFKNTVNDYIKKSYNVGENIGFQNGR